METFHPFRSARRLIQINTLGSIKAMLAGTSTRSVSMRLRTLTMLLALGFAPAAFAQAPAPAAKPTIPQFCTNCHQAAPGQLQGFFENVAFKSQSIQMKVDAHTYIVRFDPKAIKVVEAGDPKPADAMRDIRKGHEARIVYAEKDGVKTATEIHFKGPIKIAPEKLAK